MKYTTDQIKKLKSIKKVNYNYASWLDTQIHHGHKLKDLTFENFCNNVLSDMPELNKYIDNLSLN